MQILIPFNKPSGSRHAQKTLFREFRRLTKTSQRVVLNTNTLRHKKLNQGKVVGWKLIRKLDKIDKPHHPRKIGDVSLQPPGTWTRPLVQVLGVVRKDHLICPHFPARQTFGYSDPLRDKCLRSRDMGGREKIHRLPISVS